MTFIQVMFKLIVELKLYYFPIMFFTLCYNRLANILGKAGQKWRENCLSLRAKRNLKNSNIPHKKKLSDTETEALYNTLLSPKDKIKPQSNPLLRLLRL